MLLALDADHEIVGGRLTDEGRIGILDSLRHRWVVLPWSRGERSRT